MFTAQVAELVFVGASIGANCELCLRWHHKHARERGVSDRDMASAVSVAQMVKEMPARRVLALADRLGISDDPGDDVSPCCVNSDAPCCCADDDEDGLCCGDETDGA